MSEVNIYQSKPDDFISQVSIVAAWINFQNEYLFLQRDDLVLWFTKKLDKYQGINE